MSADSAELKQAWGGAKMALYEDTILWCDTARHIVYFPTSEDSVIELTWYLFLGFKANISTGYNILDKNLIGAAQSQTWYSKPTQHQWW